MTADDRSPTWAKIAGPCYTASGMADTVGWTDDQVIQAGEDLRLLAMRTSDDVVVYPAFQLHDGRVVDGLQDVLRILRTGTAGRWTWAQFLNVPLHGERAQIEILREGRLDKVLRDARNEAASWGAS